MTGAFGWDLALPILWTVAYAASAVVAAREYRSVPETTTRWVAWGTLAAGIMQCALQTAALAERGAVVPAWIATITGAALCIVALRIALEGRRNHFAAEAPER